MPARSHRPRRVGRNDRDALAAIASDIDDAFVGLTADEPAQLFASSVIPSPKSSSSFAHSRRATIPPK